jgi:ribosomal protein S18 acetylase RimI-like enzyme
MTAGIAAARTGSRQVRVRVSAATPAEREWAAHLIVSMEPWKTFRLRPAAARAAQSRPGNELFIAHHTRGPVGFILLNAHGLASAPYIKSIAVAPQQQRKGIGTKLLQFAERKFRKRRFVYLCVSEFNGEARRLYERLGYAVVAELKDHAMEGHSELLMRKRLRK